MDMRQFWTPASRRRFFLVVAAISVITLAASGPTHSAVRGSRVIDHLTATLGWAAGAAEASQGSAYWTQRLRWPSRPNLSATYHLRFKSLPLRAASLRVYGKPVPRGFGFDFIVACEHRGPAVLNWNWAQAGGYVRITVRMTTGLCDLPGPTVAGRYVTLSFRLVR
jgi:hypothetical protein